MPRTKGRCGIDGVDALYCVARAGCSKKFRFQLSSGSAGGEAMGMVEENIPV